MNSTLGSVVPLAMFNLPMNKICREMMRAVLKTYYYHYQHCHHLYCKKTENWSPDEEDDKRRNDENNKEDDNAKRLLLICSHELAFHDRTGVQQYFLVNSNISRPVEPAWTFDEILTLFAAWGWLTLLVSFLCSWRLPVLKRLKTSLNDSQIEKFTW